MLPPISSFSKIEFLKKKKKKQIDQNDESNSELKIVY